MNQEDIKVIDTYKVDFKPTITCYTYHLERYEVNRLETGDYSVLIQEGDCCAGGAYTTFIAKESIRDKSFGEILDIIPLANQKKEDLINDNGLKRFLGCQS